MYKNAQQVHKMCLLLIKLQSSVLFERMELKNKLISDDYD